MYTDEYLARHKNHSCHDEHYYHGDYKYDKTNCSGYNLYCPYMHICPLMQQQNKHYEYPIMQMPKSSYSIKDDSSYREENYKNYFRHPFGHMSYYYDEHDNDNEHEHHYNYDNHHHSSEGYDDNYNTYPYVNHDYYEHELNPYYENYYYQSPFTQYPILPQLPFFEDEEEEHEEHEHHHDNE